MEEVVIEVLKEAGISCERVSDLEGKEVSRDVFLSGYEPAKFTPLVERLRKFLSSSSLTALQSGASKAQRWPLLNLVRQILRAYKLQMTPLRKCDGRTQDGKKKFKRFFVIERQN